MPDDPSCQAPQAPTGAVPRTCVPFAHVPAVPVVAVPYVPVPVPSGLPVLSVSGVFPDRTGNVDVSQFLSSWTGEFAAAKADKVPSASAGNLASLDASGNLVDSGKKPADFADAAQFAAHRDNTTIHIAATERSAWNAKYDKPSGGIPKSDLAEAVRASLGKADTAIQNHQSLDAYVNAAGYDSDAKEIQLKHGSTVLATIDATAFIKDGMISEVKIVGSNLVITFNADAGKESISIPLSQIFNPANYYDKTAADNRFVQKEAGKGLVAVDAALSTEGAAADAKAVGDALRSGFTEWACDSISEGFEFGKCERRGGDSGLGWYVTVVLSSGEEAVYFLDAGADTVSLSQEESPYDPGFSLSRRLVTPTKTSQLANDGAPDGGGTPYATTAQVAAKQDALSAAQLANIAAVPNKANAADLPYRLVEPGEWEFSDGQSYVVGNPEEVSEEGWAYAVQGLGYSQFFSTQADALAALSLTFDGADPVVTATRASLPGHLLDRAGNRVVVTGDTTLTLPAANPGYLRDFLVRLEISGSTVPTITFAAPTGETITWDDAGSPTATYEAGTHLLRFTEVATSVFHFADLGDGGSIDPAVLNGKLEATSAAPAFDATKTYSVGEYVTYEGVLYECSMAVTTAGAWTGSTNWTARDMTTPDATLDLMADGRLRLVSADGDVLWMQGYDLAPASSVALSCDKVNFYAFASGTVTQAFDMPSAPSGKVGDFVLDVDNTANASASATATLTGAGTAFDVFTPEGVNLSTDILTFAGGEQCELYFTMTAFGTAAKPAWKVVKQIVEKQEFGS